MRRYYDDNRRYYDDDRYEGGGGWCSGCAFGLIIGIFIALLAIGWLGDYVKYKEREAANQQKPTTQVVMPKEQETPEEYNDVSEEEDYWATTNGWCKIWDGKGSYIGPRKVIEKPFKRGYGAFLVEFEINGEKVRGIIDTGCTNVSVGKTTAERLLERGVLKHERDPVSLLAADGHNYTKRRWEEDVTIDGVGYTNVLVSETATETNTIGISFMAKFEQFEVDCMNGVIRMFPRGIKPPTEEGCIAAKYDHSAGCFMADMEVGSGEIYGILDSGATYTGITFEECKELYESGQIKEPYDVTYLNIGGGKDKKCRKWRTTCAIGGAAVTDVMIAECPCKKNLIGLNVLSQFSKFYISANETMTLVPKAAITAYEHSLTHSRPESQDVEEESGLIDWIFHGIVH